MMIIIIVTSKIIALHQFNMHFNVLIFRYFVTVFISPSLSPCSSQRVSFFYDRGLLSLVHSTCDKLYKMIWLHFQHHLAIFCLNWPFKVKWWCKFYDGMCYYKKIFTNTLNCVPYWVIIRHWNLRVKNTPFCCRLHTDLMLDLFIHLHNRPTGNSVQIHFDIT